MRLEATLAAVTATTIFLAQTTTAAAGSPTLDLLSQLISALGPMGFVMWLVWRTTNHTIPALAKSFEDSVERQRADFRASLTEQRADFLAALERERQMCSKLMDKLSDKTDREGSQLS